MMALVQPLADTFSLASLSTSSKTIYLDFEGERVRSTQWNTQLDDDEILCNPWSIDGNQSQFDDDERLVIQHVWARVAEDFAPFNVNVVTAPTSGSDLTYSGVADTRWGIHVVISNGDRGNDENPAGNSRGVAIAKSIRSVSGEAVCFVSADSSLNLNPSEIAEEIANVASMQVGLALGLERHGVASTAGAGSSGSVTYNGHGTPVYWSPIMGGPYIPVTGLLPTTRVSQWSRGEYLTASRPGQDDVGIIAGVFGYRTDDHANTSARASALTRPVGDPKWRGTGIIGTTSDVDVFVFNVGIRPVTINVVPLEVVGRAPNTLLNGTQLSIDPFGGANLDVGATLWTAEGRFVADLGKANALDAAYVNKVLPAGRYILKVFGSGNGSAALDGYSAYGSLGRYTVTVDDGTPLPSLPVVTIAGPATSILEGAAGTFTISISRPVTATFRIGYRTYSGTATEGRDYTGQSSAVTFRPGGPLSLTVSIRTIDDRLAESDEAFTVGIVSVPLGASVDPLKSKATGTIRYNDGGSPVRAAFLSAVVDFVTQGGTASKMTRSRFL